ncbi:sensor histidine kinase [Streptomyces albireticuli]|uniref:sensor histidine kinase n=1 Tax=Streptomyces albireticuli TaxID=1940 RepID=UPI00369917E4
MSPLRLLAPTARTRIAVAFGAVFVVLGGLLLLTVNLLSRAGTRERAGTIARLAVPVRRAESTGPALPSETRELTVSTVHRVSGDVSAAASRELVLWSGVALLVTALLAVGVGWWIAGRALRPVHAAFDSQRRFVSNASHELRTPLATQRAAIQVGLDGDPSPAELARTKEVLLAANRRSERLIDGLLALARSERGLERRDPLDLAEVVAEEVAAVAGRAERGEVRIGVEASPAPLRGNRVLLAQLTGNLLRNAVEYNHRGGTVEVRVGPGRLSVRNTGPVVAAADVDGLFEPFRRGRGRERTGGAGAGLGLSIVRSIARAHGGVVRAVPAVGGGLRVTVELPGP